MKLGTFISSAALVAAVLALNTFAQDRPRTIKDAKSVIAKADVAKPASDPKMDEMMKKWMEVASPGREHKVLEAFVGEWDVVSKWQMAPDAPPDVSKGKSKVRSILGGRFVQEEHTGEFAGKPFHGLGITGYDNLKKKYVSFWIDDAGTAMFVSEGAGGADGKAFTFEGKMDDPMTGEKNKTMKFNYRIVDANKHVFEMHDPSKGEKSLCAEMIYTRK